MKTLSSFVVTLSIVLPSPVVAHHTVAYTYDVSKLVPLTGTITGVEWKRPHVIYRLAVPGPDGSLANWEIESRHLQGMRDSGIEMDTIKVGDVVTMSVMVALDGTRHAATASVRLANGRTVRICTVTEGRCPSD